MSNVISAIRDTVPIGQFNRGLAGKVFDEVKRTGPKVVIKNNIPDCVLISPEEYAAMVDEINDARLLAIASVRMESFDPEHLISEEEMDRGLHITEQELNDSAEVDFE